jgi:hypothetical protein
MINPIVSAQLALAASASLLAAFAPPAQGRMLLVPIGSGPVTETMVRDVSATPLKPGPLPGSWVVDGNRQSLAPLLSQGILVLAAPAAACVTSRPGDGSRS